jgi:hypothetical protein
VKEIGGEEARARGASRGAGSARKTTQAVDQAAGGRPRGEGPVRSKEVREREEAAGLDSWCRRAAQLLRGQRGVSSRVPALLARQLSVSWRASAALPGPCETPSR